MARAILLSAAHSGGGKTIVTIGLQRALMRRDLRVAGAKTGPDYIDPAFHAAATGRPSCNLDSFAMYPEMIADLAWRSAKDVDLIVAEGAMGLFDGVAGVGSTAGIADQLGWPVVIIIDAQGAAQTLAAVAHGIATFPGAPDVVGAIVNRVASERHGRMIADGFAAIDMPLLGLIRRDERLVLPSRHLGLVQAGETAELDARIDAIADIVADQCDLPRIESLARPVATAPAAMRLVRPPGQRIAVARDAAFTFLYPHLLDGWRRAGAEIHIFSPLLDEAPPPDCDFCWLPGGYPELHAPRLAAATRFLTGLQSFADRHPVHGECGGYMVLGDALQDADGVTYPMAGLLPIETSFARPRLHLGYRRAVWREAMPFADRGTTSIGHEYHYATITRADGEALADMLDGEGCPLPPAGTRRGHVSGSFFHIIA